MLSNSVSKGVPQIWAASTLLYRSFTSTIPTLKCINWNWNLRAEFSPLLVITTDLGTIVNLNTILGHPWNHDSWTTSKKFSTFFPFQYQVCLQNLVFRKQGTTCVPTSARPNSADVLANLASLAYMLKLEEYLNLTDCVSCVLCPWWERYRHPPHLHNLNRLLYRQTGTKDRTSSGSLLSSEIKSRARISY